MLRGRRKRDVPQISKPAQAECPQKSPQPSAGFKQTWKSAVRQAAGAEA
jgi:hypothetical protein